MLKYDNKNWFSFIFRHGSKHVEGMWFSMLFMAALTAILIFLEVRLPWFHLEIDSSFHTVIGIVLGLLLVFRTNSAYDRWWEGRKLWGNLVNSSRQYTIKIQAYVPICEERTKLISLIQFFPFVLKEHLRDTDYSTLGTQIPSFLKQRFDAAKHKPNAVLNAMAQLNEQVLKKGMISDEQLLVLEKETEDLINILGGCERIKNTPIPMAYALHLKRVLLVYCGSLPFVMINKLGWWSIPVVLIVFYTMLGIELIGEEIEDPFGLDDNDLPVDELCDKIYANIKELKEWNG